VIQAQQPVRSLREGGGVNFNQGTRLSSIALRA